MAMEITMRERILSFLQGKAEAAVVWAIRDSERRIARAKIYEETVIRLRKYWLERSL
jgi:hypothetical protein